MAEAKTWRPKRHTYSVQIWSGRGEWLELARFWMDQHARFFCAEFFTDHPMRVMRGRTTIAEYSAKCVGKLKREAVDHG